MKSKFFWLAIAAIIILVTRITLESLPQNKPWHKENWQSLYTHINLTIQGDSADVQKIIRELDVFFSSYTKKYQSGSSLDSQLQQSHHGDTLVVDSLTWELLKFAEFTYKESQGAIHPGIGGLIRAWGLEWGLKPHVPSDSIIHLELNKMKSLFYQTIPGGKKVAILADSGEIALGAFSKGYALEYARHRLILAGFKNFLLEIGGDLVYNGTSPRGKRWVIGITDPNQKEGNLLAIELPEHFNSMATSGGYERHFTDSLGNKFHHILDPRTGKSTTQMKSATVLANGGHNSDFLATWMFILGIEDAYQNDLKHKDFQTILVGPQDSLRINPELQPYILK